MGQLTDPEVDRIAARRDRDPRRCPALLVVGGFATLHQAGDLRRRRAPSVDDTVRPGDAGHPGDSVGASVSPTFGS